MSPGEIEDVFSGTTQGTLAQAGVITPGGV